jgi:hypothetical protein
MKVVGQVVTCGWWLGDGSGCFYWAVVGKGAGGYGGQVERGARVVVMVVGHWVHSLGRDKSKKKQKNLPFFFLVSVLGMVGVDLVGQVVCRMYGGWSLLSGVVGEGMG